MRKSLIKIVCLLLIVGLNWTGLLAVGQTFAFFSNTEDSNDNTFTAATLDLSLRSGQGNFISPAENMKPGDSTARDIYVGKTADSLPLKHSVSYNFIDGDEDFCNQLQLKVWYNHYHGPVSGGYDNRDMRLKYDGKLSTLADYRDNDFEIPHPDDQFDTDPSDGTEQWFFYSIILPIAIPDSFQGKVCNFKFVYEAWQTNLPNSSQGFTDKEELESTIKTGYWDPPVVLNEFLPNAGSYPEFIELYNKTGSPINLQGYKIRANGHPIPINPTTTDLFSGGNTVISLYGWLVVARPHPDAPGWNNILNNSSGTITLYDQNEIIMDSYTYGNPEHNINNTPGGTNNLVGYWPFDNDVQDKSGNGNNGTNYGATFDVGKINQALSFDGVNDYVEVSDAASLDITDKITVETWVKANTWDNPGAPYNVRNIIDKAEHETGRSYGLYFFGGLLHFRINKNSNADASGALPLLGEWNHIAGTYNGSEVKLYVNGAKVGEKSYSGTILTNDKPLYIGAGVARQYWFSGLIDEVKIYNRALDATEILQHYNDVGSLGAVPSDKSYARIPDGVDNWVDPIPTPGGPNILESEIINQEEAIEEEPIVEEEPLAEELPVEETPVSEEESISERESVIEEETTGAEVISEENQEQGGIIEEINEIIDGVIDEIVDEIMPDETADEPAEEALDEVIIPDETILEPEAPIIEEPAVEDLVIEEATVVDEQPAVIPDEAGESVNDGGGDTSGSSDGSSPAEVAGESL